VLCLILEWGFAQYDDGNDDDDGRQWNFIVSVQNDGDIDQF
jgi:hypothetical protein